MAYYGNLRRRKYLIDILPTWLLTYLYPVTRHFPRDSYVLDVGSGSGLYSYICRTKFGCEVDSLEPYMEDAFDNNTIKESILHYKSKVKYDRVFLIDVLEHFELDMAKEVIRCCQNQLKNEGQILIKVPNAGSSLGLQSHFGDVTHRMGYSDVGLEQLVNQAGLKVVEKCYIGANRTPMRVAAGILATPYSLFKGLYLYSKGISFKSESVGLFFSIK